MRKLVTIRRVSDIIPITGADRIELALIDGWQVVVKKGEFVVGDKGVFFEIDSFLPNDPRYEFVGKLIRHQGQMGYRVKTIKLRKQLSQGLLLPLSMFSAKLDQPVGVSVTSILNVTKYDVNLVKVSEEKSKSTKSNKANAFPSFLRKTDQERIQNLTSYFTNLKGLNFEETLKLDGSSCTIYKVDRKYKWYEKLYMLFGGELQSYTFGVASRNITLPETYTNEFWKACRRYNVENELPVNYAIQGELISPTIQGNHEKVQDVELYVFDVFDIKKQEYLLPDARVEFINKMTVPHVKIVNSSVDIFSACDTLDALLHRVDGNSIDKGVISEGRVYKSTTSSLSFKCVNNRYLLKCEV